MTAPSPRRATAAADHGDLSRTELWAPRGGTGCAILILLAMLLLTLPMAAWPGAPGLLRGFGALCAAIALWGLWAALRPDPLAASPWAVADPAGITFAEIGRHFAWPHVSRVILDRGSDFPTLYVYLHDQPVLSDDNPVPVPLTLPPRQYPRLLAMLEQGLGRDRVTVM